MAIVHNIQIVVTEYQGKQYLDIRKMYKDANDELKPTPKGIMIPLEHAGEVLNKAVEVLGQDAQSSADKPVPEKRADGKELIYIMLMADKPKLDIYDLPLCQVFLTQDDLELASPSDANFPVAEAYLYKVLVAGKDYKIYTKGNQTNVKIRNSKIKLWKVWSKSKKGWVPA